MNIEYIPRHRRIGVNLTIPVLECHHEILVEVPVQSDDRNILVVKESKVVPVSESLGKYKVGDFAIKELAKNGVSQRAFVMNRSLGHQIEDLVNICQGLDNSESYVNRIILERKEAESWFPPQSDKNEK